MFGQKVAKKKQKNSAKKNLKPKYLCLDIGSHSIKGVVGSAGVGKIKVEKAFEVKLQKDIFDNGRILNEEEMVKAVKAALLKHDIKVKDVIVTIDSSELIKREIVLPEVEEDDMGEMLSYEIGEYLPIDINNFVFQYRTLSTFEQDNSKKMNVLVAALPKDLIEDIFFMLEKVGLTPWFLDIHSNSLEKLFNPQYMNNIYTGDNTYVFIDLGNSLTNVMFLSDGIYRFNRIMKFGGKSVEEMMYFSHGYEGQRELQDRLKEISLLDYADSNNTYTVENSEDSILFGNIANLFLGWIDDIEKVISYYRSRPGAHSISKIFLYGGNSRYKDLDRLFDRRLGIQTVLIDRVDGVDFPQEGKEEVYKYINALSGLIRR